MQFFREIEVADLVDLLDKDDPNLHLVDIRNDNELVHGAIPGATHLPMHLLPIKINELDKEKTTVLYCHLGIRSAKACAYLSAYGYDRVHNLRGGIQAWERSGLEMVYPPRTAA